MTDSQDFSFGFSKLIERLVDQEGSLRQIEINCGLSNGSLRSKNPTIKTLEKVLNTYPLMRSWLLESLTDDYSMLAREQEPEYATLKDKYIDTLEELKRLTKEHNDLKNFVRDKGIRKLNPQKK